MLHVFQHEGGRLVVAEDGGKIEEVALRLFHVVEAVLAADAVLLVNARQAEGLAGKAGYSPGQSSAPSPCCSPLRGV